RTRRKTKAALHRQARRRTGAGPDLRVSPADGERHRDAAADSKRIGMPANRPIPPPLAEALLRWTVGSDDAEIIGGDLEETLSTDPTRYEGWPGPRAWYWRQVLSIVVARVFASADHSLPRKAKRNAMAAIQQDFVQAIRVLRKQPAFTSIALLM